ncbi:phosphoglycolate phosphatase [Streptosporangium becharense]|uniref:Phosphoglycolate phosphatase n=1 Tax=Streptosporangium becharense TaxID=1816182 RepID=A0A7W9IIU6_9ACTN|nr:HAD family hydrolase [Streptosporangium becharense]MBB2914745.1 phosphoglycolate phosphatase [Streptosporangium becharense]MBB5820854.1 phosphoglycolate phosphatase [Streptosporangium becharense]
MDSVGFDLDLTLADTRAGIAAVYDELSVRLGVHIDSAAVVARLGPPLEWELANWLPAAEIPAAADTYRALYPSIAVPLTTLMPGAREAVEAVRRAGGRVTVVTGKNTNDAVTTVEFLGLEVDEVAGSVFGAEKGPALAAFGAAAYVGDHVADIEAARAGGVVSVAVATGGYPAGDLRDYGADVILGDLTEFAEWFDGWRTPAAVV